MLMSEEQEVQLGRSYDPQVMATFGEYQDNDLQAFVQAKGAEIGKISHRPNIEYHVKVVDSPVVNAFAVPGGYVYLTRGILAQLNNEAELLGVMSHEIGHIAARHTVSQQSKQTLGQLVLIGGMVASEKFAQYAQYAMQGMQLLFLRFSRDDEREADRLGVEYSSKIGYDAHKMADFFKVLSKMSMSESEGGIPTFMSTHPDPGDRYNSVNKKATEWQARLKLPEWKVNQDSYLQMVNGIVYGEDPRQGYVEGNIFYHLNLNLNSSSFRMDCKTSLQVTILPGDGKALILFTLASKNTGSGRLSNCTDWAYSPGQEKTTVNGMPAIYTLQADSQDQSTGATSNNMVLSYFIVQQLTMCSGVSSEADFANYSGSFESTPASFSKLTDAAKINVIPKRIQVVKVQRTGTFSNALSSFGVRQAQYEELALLNNLELTSQVQAGKLIKIIGE
jgi:predicted Zn-dependent protease